MAGLLIIGLKMANQISTQPTKHLKVSEPDTSNVREQSTTSMGLPSSSRYNKPFNYYERIYFVKIQSQYLFDYNITSKLWIIPPFRMAACGLCSHQGMDMTFRVTECRTHGEVSIMSWKWRVNIPKICFKWQVIKLSIIFSRIHHNLTPLNRSYLHWCLMQIRLLRKTKSQWFKAPYARGKFRTICYYGNLQTLS